MLYKIAAALLLGRASAETTGPVAATDADITVHPEKPLDYAISWSKGVNQGDGKLEPGVEGANWCDQSYPNQSPINLMDSDTHIKYVTAPLDVTMHTVAETRMELTSNGVEFELRGNWATLVHDGQTYEATQLHFHSPSEHVFNNMYCAGEMHIVMNNADPTIQSGDPNGHAVLAFCLEMGLFPDLFFVKAGNVLAESSAEEVVTPGYESKPLLGWSTSSFMHVLKDNFAYYVGSYTTPSCDPNINWFMMQTPIGVPVATVEFMNRVFAHPANHRPIQALAGREIKLNFVCDCATDYAATATPHDQLARKLLFGATLDPEVVKESCKATCAEN